MSGRLWMLSRKHPPSVGGMQQLSFHLVRGLSARRPVTAVVWGGGQWALPLWMAWAQLRLLAGLLRGEVGVLHLGDPALAVLGWLPRKLGVPVFATVHGLDLTHPSRIYQAYLRLFFWGRMAAYACISRHVQSLVAAQGIARDAAPVLPVGIDPAQATDPPPAPPRDAQDPVVELLCIGRLVPRKGVAWFLDAVAPAWLARHPHARLRIAGDGPERERIAAVVADRGLDARVQLLGAVDEATKWRLLDAADLVLMPNRHVPGDAEGFGLVCLEAGVRGAWVLASDLEGLRDAIAEGENGMRVPAGDVAAWTAALDSLCAQPSRLRALGAQARERVVARFGWPAIAARYDRLVQDIAPDAARGA